MIYPINYIDNDLRCKLTDRSFSDGGELPKLITKSMKIKLSASSVITLAGQVAGTIALVKTSPNAKKECDRLYDQLLQIAKDNNIEIYSNDFKVSNYLSITECKKLQNSILLSKDESNEIKEVLETFSDKKGIINFDPSMGPEVLAHELGHSINDKNSKWHNIIMMCYHIIMLLAGKDKSRKYAFISTISALGIGMGILEYYREYKGKSGILDKLKDLIPIAFASTMLVEEGMASMKAISLLKSLGVTSNEMKTSKIRLGMAFSSYVSSVTFIYLIYLIGIIIGRFISRSYYLNK